MKKDPCGLAGMFDVRRIDCQRAQGATDDDWRMCLLKAHSIIYRYHPELCWMRYPERPSIRTLGYPYRISPRYLRMAIWTIEDGIMLSYFPNTIYGPPDLLGRVEDLSYYFRHQR